MQYVEGKTKPESNRKYLVQQVEEQSDLCDVIVKMGHWEKKFHRCVLVANPFFDCVLKNNFIEKQTGKIEIKLCTPSTVEMAIMFLYGKRPKLSLDNIEHVLHLAEFFLIPNLKFACISWLKTVIITEENCMTLLQLSSIYDFEIRNCIAYIEEHLSEMLRHFQMLDLTANSIDILFSDRKLSYVPMDEKLLFLLKWRDKQPDQRNAYMKKLLATVDFQDVSKLLLQELKEDHTLKDNINFEHLLETINNESSTRPVIIMRGEHGNGSFWCLDLEREKWFRINSRALEEQRSFRCNNITGTGNNDFEIYFANCGYQESELLTLNLQSDTCKTFKFVVEGSGNDLEAFDHIQMQAGKCIVNVNENVETSKQKTHTPQSIDEESHLQHMSLQENSSIEPVFLSQMMQDNDTMSSVYTATSTLYIGEVDGDIIRMSPLLTFKDDQILKICVNNNFSVAMLFTKVVAIFDLADHTLESFQVETDYEDKLVQSENGFVVHNDNRCICLERLTFPSHSTKYVVKEILFLPTEFSLDKFYFCENIWYHYYCKNYDEEPKFESTHHSSIVLKGSMNNVTWKPLPLPKDGSRCHADTINDTFFQICIPKCLLRCDIECPHCKLASRVATTRVSSDDDSDDYYYGDSSGDDHHSSSFYDDDYSDNYYDAYLY